MFPNMGYKNQWHSCYPGTTYDEISYIITAENISGQTLNDIMVEYSIYHQTTINEQSEKGELRKIDNGRMALFPMGSVKRYPEQTVSNIIQGTLCFKLLQNNERQNQSTDSLRLIEQARELMPIPGSNSDKSGDYKTNNTRRVEGKILGIRYRVYAPTPAGNYAMMEFSDPESLIERTEWPNQ